MKWSGRANKQVVEAVVTAFHDSAEISAHRLSRLTTRDWQRSYHWLDASGMALYFLDRVESLRQNCGVLGEDGPVDLADPNRLGVHELAHAEVG